MKHPQRKLLVTTTPPPPPEPRDELVARMTARDWLRNLAWMCGSANPPNFIVAIMAAHLLLLGVLSTLPSGKDEIVDRLSRIQELYRRPEERISLRAYAERCNAHFAALPSADLPRILGYAARLCDEYKANTAAATLRRAADDYGDSEVLVPTSQVLTLIHRALSRSV